jgi:hypothetical protein
MKTEKRYILSLTHQQYDDILNAVSIAIPVAKKEHKDSPKFLKSLETLKNFLWKELHRQDNGGKKL